MSHLARVRATGREPIAVLDVDLTLVDNAPRSRAIFAAWCETVRSRWAGASQAAQWVNEMPIVFDVRTNITTLGVHDPDLAQEALAFWFDGFFRGEFLDRDVALDGAVEAVARLREAQVTILYLTARLQRMGPDTMRSLDALGFPVGVDGTILTMKDRFKTPDRVFKERALRWIGSLGTPILCADNEPGHVNAMRSAFPDALVALVETRCSPGAPPLDGGIVRTPRLLDVVWDASSVDEE
jgi:hypothetical protein